MLFEIIFASCIINVAIGQGTVVNPGQGTSDTPGPVAAVNPEQGTVEKPGLVTVVDPEQPTGDKPVPETAVNPEPATAVNQCGRLELKPVENLNISQFMNSWYGIKQSSNNTYECAMVDFHNNGTKITVHYHYNQTKNETFTFDVNTTEISDKFVTVLATNYNSYAVILKCEGNSNTSSTYQSNLWILSRNTTISPNDTARINETITTNKLENITLTAVHQDDVHCKLPVSASSVVVSSLTLVMLAFTSSF